MESKGNIETSLALVIKSYPQKITKQSIEVLALLRNVEVHEEPANEYIQKNATNMTNFG